MDPEKWRRVEALFHQARELGDAERKEFLEALRGEEEPDLIDDVEAMLQVDRQSSSELGGIVDSAIVGALERLPERVGPYKIISRIGTGGFCSVYRARAPESRSASVAVKVLKRGLASHDTEQRLRQESEILARLDHPNIAKLLGQGKSDFGEPFFVMELIEDGVPIDRYCETHRLPLEARLKLFRQVCSAVDYAHANLVIHRDIKPSNLLVTPSGTPRLLDFGIAKLLQPELSRTDPVHTIDGGSWMTPDYASPEQAREEPLTTATDVYSLGVLLYRLLCGRPPYEFPNRSPRAIEEVISQVEPPLPSSIFSGLPTGVSRPRADDGENVRELAARRGLSVSHLRARLRGDLDSIVLMALSKKAEERYSSPLELSQDIGRHLDSEPVLARRLTALYRARKFVRRHRIAVGVVMTVLLTLTAAVVMTTRATRHAEAERSRAEQHLAESQRVADFLVDIFEVPDPEITQGQDVTAKELLDEGARRIVAELKHQPEIRSSLLATMGRVYRNLGDHDKSEELLDEALEFRRQRYGMADPLVIETLHEKARSLLARGEYEAARALLVEIRSNLQSTGGSDSAPYALTLTLLAAAHKQMNRLEEAEGLARQALRRNRALLTPSDPALIESLSKVAEVLSLKRDFKAAEEIFRETLELRRRHLGESHPDVATNLGNLTFVLHGQGRLEEAEHVAREAVRIRAELYGESHWIVGTSYNNLSQILAAMGRTEDALPWMEKSLEISRARLGEKHPKIAGRLVNLALMYQRLERFEKAEGLYLQALDLHRGTLGEEHPSTARNLFQLAALLHGQERDLEALPLLDQAISILDSSLPERDIRLSHPLLLQGRVLMALGDCASALPRLRRAFEIRQAAFPSGHESLDAVSEELDRCGESSRRPSN